MTGKKFTQRLLLFDEAPAESHLESVSREPTPEALAAITKLDDWLTDLHTGRVTEFAEEAIDAVRKAIEEGRNGYVHKAEDLLETLGLWNEKAHGDDIPSGLTAAERLDFQVMIEELLDLLDERVREQGR
jgi:hypothetical protein